jgi:AcrR family transcriptional regulator
MFMKKKRDLRFQKTHRSIREAFKCLLLQKDFKAITVKEISQRANINRKTFYLHYHSIDELLMELEIEFAEQLLDMLRQEHSRMTFCQVRDICRAMNGIIKEDYELHMHLI